jgi:hypothetical protein
VAGDGAPRQLKPLSDLLAAHPVVGAQPMTMVSQGAGSLLVTRCGAGLRFCRPVTSSLPKRASHLRTVRVLTSNAVATAATLHPSSCTSRIITAGANGVVRAFLWAFIRAVPRHQDTSKNRAVLVMRRGLAPWRLLAVRSDVRSRICRSPEPARSPERDQANTGRVSNQTRRRMLVTRSASPSLALARPRPIERMTRPSPLGGEDVLDGDPDPRSTGVTAGEVRRHRPATRLCPLELRRQPAARQQRQVRCRAVGSIGPYTARRGWPHR